MYLSFLTACMYNVALGPPSAPLNVSVYVTNTSAILSWISPADDGGRNRSEIFYNISYICKGINELPSIIS